jgi:hypothetical protein
MRLKEVYAIRINKNDKVIKEYLQRYPQSAHGAILKSLIVLGIKSKNIQETNEKIEEVLALLKSQPTFSNEAKELPKQDEPPDEEVEIDLDAARKTMSEALSMLMNS